MVLNSPTMKPKSMAPRMPCYAWPGWYGIDQTLGVLPGPLVTVSQRSASLHTYSSVYRNFSICCAIENSRVAEKVLGKLVVYCHLTFNAKCVPDEIENWVLD